MQTLKRSLTLPLRAVPSSLVIAIFIVALIGFADAAYLTVEHYQGVIPPCSLTGGCEKVLTSAYSTVAGIPVSLVGAAYYLLIAVGSLIYLESKHISKADTHNSSFLKWGLLLTVPGFLASIWFFAAQAFILHSYCLYCLGSAITTTILFALAIFTLKKYQGEALSPKL